MSVTASIFGDFHFKVTNVKETTAMTKACLRVAAERKPNFIVCLGDTLDRHESIHVSPLTRAVNFLASLSQIAPVYLLIGNHDLKNNRQFLSEEHPFVALKYWTHTINGMRAMTVVDTTTVAVIKGQSFIFVPYVPPGSFIEALNMCPGWEAATCIFAHQEFRGAQMGALVSAEGDEWLLTYPYVISGHIHEYQEPQENMLYTGTPIQHAFGDRHDKTVSYVTFRSHTERIHERIDLGLPHKYIIYLTCAEISTYMPPENTDLKIQIRGTSGAIKAIMKHPNIIAWKQAGHKIVYKDIPLAKDTGPEKVFELKKQLRFSTALYDAVNANPRLAPLYTKIFGSVRVDGLLLNQGAYIEVPIPKVNITPELKRTLTLQHIRVQPFVPTPIFQ